MINHAWLPTGEGEMLKPEKSSPVSNAVLVRDIEAIEVPLYNINALAGIRPGQADGEEVEEMLPWINAKEGDFAVRFDGDSMEPRVHDVTSKCEDFELAIVFSMQIVVLSDLVGLVFKHGVF